MIAVARSSRIRTLSAAIRSLLSAAYMAALSANSALPSRSSTSRIRALSASTCGGGWRYSLRDRAVGRFDQVLARQGIGRRLDDVVRLDDAAQAAIGQRLFAVGPAGRRCSCRSC